MVLSISEIDNADPLRAPDWRWQRAGELAKSNRRLTASVADDSTARAARFLRRQAQGKRPAPDRTLKTACALHQSPNLAALGIEARLLASQSIADVSHVTGQAREAVASWQGSLVVDRLAVRLRAPAADGIEIFQGKAERIDAVVAAGATRILPVLHQLIAEAQSLRLHDVVEHRAVGTAAETVIKPFLLVNRE